MPIMSEIFAESTDRPAELKVRVYLLDQDGGCSNPLVGKYGTTTDFAKSQADFLGPRCNSCAVYQARYDFLTKNG